MKKFFTHPLTIAVIVILALIAAYYGYRYYQNKDLPRAKGGSAPTDEDKNCASGGTSGLKIIGMCTKPHVFPVPPKVAEKCYSSDELGLKEGDSGYAAVTDNFGKKWFFNYQSGDRFCYTDKQF